MGEGEVRFVINASTIIHCVLQWHSIWRTSQCNVWHTHHHTSVLIIFRICTALNSFLMICSALFHSILYHTTLLCSTNLLNCTLHYIALHNTALNDTTLNYTTLLSLLRSTLLRSNRHYTTHLWNNLESSNFATPTVSIVGPGWRSSPYWQYGQSIKFIRYKSMYARQNN